MKISYIFITLFSMISMTHAAVLSSCDEACFSKKMACNDRKSHTFNSCNDELFVCRASCNSGAREATYDKSPPIKISFRPILE